MADGEITEPFRGAYGPMTFDYTITGVTKDRFTATCDDNGEVVEDEFWMEDVRPEDHGRVILGAAFRFTLAPIPPEGCAVMDRIDGTAIMLNATEEITFLPPEYQ